MMIRTFTLCLCMAAGLPCADYHVAPTGDDASAEPSNPATPLRTIQGAVERLRAGDRLVIHAGRYRESVRVRVRGSADRPVEIVAAEGERVIVDGTEPIEALALPGAAWRRHQGEIWSIELRDRFDSRLNQAEQLFLDEEMLPLARHPSIPWGVDRMLPGPDAWLTVDEVVAQRDVTGETEWGPIAKGGAMQAVFRDHALSGLPSMDDAWIWIKPEENRSWGFGLLAPVIRHQGSELEVVITDTTGSIVQVAPHVRYCFLDALHLLDDPGEWWFDRNQRRLYLWLPDGGDPTGRHLTMKRRDLAFDLSDCSHLTLRGIEVIGATITTDEHFGDGVGGGAWLTHNRGTVDAPDVQGNASAEAITIVGARIRYPSHFEGLTGNGYQYTHSSGVMLVGTGHRLIDSAIAYSAGNGVVLYGPDHVVRNNIIHDVNYAAAICSGIFMSEAPGNTPGERIVTLDAEIAHNTLFRAGWGLIDGSNLYSRDPAAPSRIHHNLLDGAGLLTKDVGGIRFVGHRYDPPRVNGTRVDHNVIRNVVAALGNPIYFDFNDGYVCDHNLVYDCSGFININDAAEMTIANNTGFTYHGGIDGIVRESKLNGVRIVNNLLNHSLPRHPDRYAPSFEMTANIVGDAAAGAVADAASGAFIPAPGSPAIDRGIHIPTLHGHVVGAAPDIGAFEHGGPDWRDQVGADWALVRPPSDLIVAAIGDGTIDLAWRDNADNETGYVIERGYRTDHPNGGWEYAYASAVPADSSGCSVAIEAPWADAWFRVRDRRSTTSNVVHVVAGRCAAADIDFEQASGYAAGALVGQAQWILVHGARGLHHGSPDAFGLRTGPAGTHLAILADGGDNAIAAVGDLRQHFPAWSSADPLRFSLRLALPAPIPGDEAEACRIDLGGLAYHRGPGGVATSIAVRRDGTLVIAGRPVASMPADGSWTTLSGVIDPASERIQHLRLGDRQLDPLPCRGGSFDRALWFIRAGARDEAHPVLIDDLRLVPATVAADPIPDGDGRPPAGGLPAP